MLKKN